MEVIDESVLFETYLKDAIGQNEIDNNYLISIILVWAMKFILQDRIVGSIEKTINILMKVSGKT